MSAADIPRAHGGLVRSVNLAVPHATRTNDYGVTGIDRRPVTDAVDISDPGVFRGAPGLAGDVIGDKRDHGGSDQAVYAYAGEDLDGWARELGRALPSGSFGENLTTEGIDVTDARIGERWAIGDSCILEVTSPRIPCATFAEWLEDQGWVRRFTQAGNPGAYLRVVQGGAVRAGDAIERTHVPPHDVTIGLMFRAMTTQKSLLPELAPARDALPAPIRARLDEALATR